MISNFFKRTALLLALGLTTCVLTANVRAGEPVPFEELLPEETVLMIQVPDFQAARAAVGSTQLAEMYAQPEMKAFTQPAIEQMVVVYNELRVQNPMLPALEDLDKGILSGEVAIGFYADSVVDAGGGGVHFSPFLRLLPSDPKALGKMIAIATGNNLPADGETIELGRTDGILRLGNEFLFGDIKKFGARAKDPAARAKSLAGTPAFRAARERLKSSSTFVFLNAGWLLSMGAKNAPGEFATQGGALGLTQLNSIAIGFGVHEKQPFAEAWIGGALSTGLPALLQSTTKIQRNALRAAGPDALFVSASSVRFSQLLPTARSLVAAFEPRQVRMLDGMLAMAQMKLGIDLQNDILGALGDEIVIVRSGTDTAPPLSLFAPGLLASIAVKDAAKLQASLPKLANAANQLLNNVPLVRMKTLAHREATIHYLGFPLGSGIFGEGIAFALVGDRLLAANSVNAVRRGIDQLASAESILDNKAFQSTIARLSGKPFDPDALPGSFAFDTGDATGGPVLTATAFAMVAGTAALGGLAELPGMGALPREGGGHAGLGELEQLLRKPFGKTLARIGQSVDLNFWPDEQFFLKYSAARGWVSVWRPDGYYTRSDIPVPAPGMRVSSMGPAVIPLISLGAALTLPVLSRAKETARRTSSASQMRQIGIALMQFENVPANGQFPLKIEEIFPEFVGDDVKIFKNPRFIDEDVGYIYLPGQSSVDGGQAIVLFESVPDNRVHEGFNVLSAIGTVEFLTEAEGKQRLEAALQVWAQKNPNLKPQPVSFEAMKARAAKKR